jgi:hypothetical protein
LLEKINIFIETTIVKFLLYCAGIIFVSLEYKNHNYNNYYLSLLLLLSVIYILIIKFFAQIYRNKKEIEFINSQFRTLNHKELALILNVYNKGTAYASVEHSDVIKSLISKRLIKPILEEYLKTYPVSLTNKCITFLESKKAKIFLQQYNVNLLGNK